MTRRFPTLLDELWFLQLPKEDKERIYRIVRGLSGSDAIVAQLERKYG